MTHKASYITSCNIKGGWGRRGNTDDLITTKSSWMHRQPNVISHGALLHNVCTGVTVVGENVRLIALNLY